jgi:putative Holliday junction resolvase
MPEARAATPAAGLVVLGFDFGTRRIGVAIGNDLTGGARPLSVLDASADAHWSAIAAQIKEWQPARLLVGVARHPDGAAHEMTARCERFARQLEGRFHLPVERVDERYSSAVLGREGGPARRSSRASGSEGRDDQAAAVIVQQWLDEHSPPSPALRAGEGPRERVVAVADTVASPTSLSPSPSPARERGRGEMSCTQRAERAAHKS